MWSFAWQNLITRPTRTLLAVVGLTIPVLAFLGLFALSGGIRNLMGDTLARMQGLIVLRANSPAPVFSDLPAELVGKLHAVKGVGGVAPELWRIAPPIDGRTGLAAAIKMLAKAREKGGAGLLNTVLIEGQDLDTHLKLRGQAFAQGLLPKEKGGGRFLDLGDVGQPRIVISTKIARDYPNADGTPKSVGQTLKIGPRDFEVIGIYETGSIVLDVTIVMEITAMRETFAIGPDVVSTIVVEPADPAETDAVADRIEQALPDVQVQRIAQFNGTVGGIIGKLDLFLLLAVALAMLVGGVGIANTMLMSTSERYVEFGVMRTNGWTRRNILALVTAESVLLGGLSGALGSLLAVAAVTTVNRFLHGFALALSPALVVVSVAAALTVAALSGLYPAWKASRMTPMDAIRHSART